MICFNDRSYCGSPGCTNECGRKMSEQDKRDAQRVGLPVSYGMFCDKVSREELITHVKKEFEHVTSE